MTIPEGDPEERIAQAGQHDVGEFERRMAEVKRQREAAYATGHRGEDIDNMVEEWLTLRNEDEHAAWARRWGVRSVTKP